MTKSKFIYDITVRFFDLDANNHVNNSVYFTYMEEARTKLLLEQYLTCKENGVHFVVAEANCKYKKQIGLQDKISIHLTVQNITGVSFEIYYDFVDSSGQLFAEGNTVMACVNEKSKKLVRLPQDIIDYFVQLNT